MRHALEHVFEVCVWLDPVEFRRGEKSGDDGLSIRAAVGSGEQMVLALSPVPTNNFICVIGLDRVMDRATIRRRSVML